MKNIVKCGNGIEVKVNIYNECKYTASAEVFEKRVTIEFKNLVEWELVSGTDAREIERDSDLVDDYHEYLVLHFENGDVSTFRNSYVDMFRI